MIPRGAYRGPRDLNPKLAGQGSECQSPRLSRVLPGARSPSAADSEPAIDLLVAKVSPLSRVPELKPGARIGQLVISREQFGQERAGRAH